MERLRESLGYTQAEAAKKAGLRGGRQYWNDIISGRRSNVTLSVLKGLAKALHVTPADLLKRE